MIGHKKLDDIFKNEPHRAFKILYLQYYVPLCLYVTRFTKSEVVSEEIVQETFMKFWERKEYKNVKENIVAYLYKIVRNNCLNYLKHEKVVYQHKQEVFERIKSVETYYSLTQENGQSVVFANELDDRIRSAIDNLPERCRKIFKMSRFEGLKNPEIAKKEGVSVNTVQKQITIALKKLRESLKDFL